MGYDHSMSFDADTVPGTTLEQVVEALSPLMAYYNYDGFEVFQRKGETYDGHVFEFDPENGVLSVYTCGDVGDSYADIVGVIADNLRPIVAAPGVILLRNTDTPDDDERTTRFVFGPSDEEIEDFAVDRDIEAGLELIAPHLDEATMDQIRQHIQNALVRSRSDRARYQTAGADEGQSQQPVLKG